MSCASCVTRVQNALQSVPGVTQARVKPGGAYCAGDGQCLPTRFSAGGGKSGLRRGSD
ncbi:cation transporter [Escherichia coli]